MEFVLLSHALVFSMIALASWYDLDTRDVPDIFCATAALGGLILHLLASLPLNTATITGFISEQGLTSILSVQGFGAILAGLGEPLTYSLTAGIVFSVLGWSAYFSGVWGGADAFAMTALGFGTPYALGNPSILGPINLFVNITLAGFLYILAFSGYKAFKDREVLQETVRKMKASRQRIGLELLVIAGVVVFFEMQNVPMIRFGVILGVMVFLHRFLQAVQEIAFYSTVKVEDLEGGEVPGPDEDFGKRIEGLSEEEIEGIEKDEIEIRGGVPFMPVFALALILTDVFGAGILFLTSVF